MDRRLYRTRRRASTTRVSAANVAIGTQALSNSTAGVDIGIGTGAGIDAAGGSHDIFIGSTGTAMDEKVIRIGSTPAPQSPLSVR